MTISTSAERIEHFCRKTGVEVLVMGPLELGSGDHIIGNYDSPFTFKGETYVSALIDEGDTVKIPAGSPDILILAEKKPIVFKGEKIKYGLMFFKSNVVGNIRRFTSSTNTDTYQEVRDDVVVYGLYGFQTNLIGQEVSDNFAFGGVTLSGDELVLSESYDIKIGDQFVVGEITDGTGVVTISDDDITGIGSTFESELYTGCLFLCEDIIQYIDTVNTETSATLEFSVSVDIVTGSSFQYLKETDEKYVVKNIKPRSGRGHGVQVLQIERDNR